MDAARDDLYPARILIKAIMSAKETEEENRRRISSAVVPAGFAPASFSYRLSRKGRWMSISFFCEVESSAELSRLYTVLKGVPGVRIIL